MKKHIQGMSVLSLLLLAILFYPLSNFAQETYIHAGQVIPMTGEKVVLKEYTLIIEGDKIKELKKGYTNPPKNATLIDLKDHTLLPGLMDMHVHLEMEFGPNSYMNRFILDEADIAFNSTVFAKRTLDAGFTTVRDLGGTGVNTKLRNAINKESVVGPRVFSAGKSIATTGGHADPTNGFSHSLMGDPGPYGGVANGPDECRKAVRQRYKNGSDCIKITATGGVLSVAKDGSRPQFTNEELEAIIETAKDYDMHVAAHAHGAEGMKRAIKAGITTIEHGTKMDSEVMDLMKQYGTYLVPTITAGKWVEEQAKIPGRYPEVVVPKALEIGPQIHNMFGRAFNAGVPILFGTDAGVFPHGLNAREFGYMVEKGMTPYQALYSATVEPAKMLKISEVLGTLENGKLADIIAVKENPLKNINSLTEVPFVMKGGKVYKSESL